LNSIALIPNTHKNLWEESTKKLAKKILSSGKNVLIDKELKKNMKEIQGITFMEFDSLINNSSMLISLGGDGTLINLAKIAAPKDIPILGINTGNLGYLVELEINEFDWLDKIFSGNFSYDTRTMLDICVIRENIAVADFLALNEALVSKGEISRLIEIEFYADNKFINSYRADGLIIATPTGSTAYSLSAGGPIIEPNTKSVVITPVCPHSLASIPIVMSSETSFEIKIKNHKDKDIYVTADGDKHFRLFENDMVRIKKSDFTTRLIRVKDRNFYTILRQKLEERIW
jgi:NAD+ kinase